MTKLRNDNDFRWFRHRFSNENELISSKSAILRVHTVWNGAEVIEGAFVGLSLQNKSDRVKARAFAEKILAALAETGGAS